VSQGHGAKLRLTIRLADGGVRTLSHRFWSHPQLAEIFPEYLCTLHASMRTTVPMLNMAEARARELADHDPVAAQLVPYFKVHAKEELHHDDWLLEDMKVLGIDTDEVLRRVPPPEIAALIGAQYYYLHHVHPLAVMGCFAVLEGSPPEVETLDAVVAESGIPKEALRTLYKHAELDPYHKDDLDEALDALPLEPEHSTLLGVSALTTIDLLYKTLERLLPEPAEAAAGG
jgi:pyrroloquinoline quinone (PQQ) biosynthesis protein C